jgi:hypothetical protein
LSSTSISATTIVGGTISGDGSQLAGVVGLTYSDLGFTITSPQPTTINQNVTLPYDSTVTYPNPMIIDSGFAVIIPEGTTLTIV